MNLLSGFNPQTTLNKKMHKTSATNLSKISIIQPKITKEIVLSKEEEETWQQ